MKLLINYILIFMASCLAAQSVEDEVVLNKVDFKHKEPIFSIVSDTTSTNHLKIYKDGEFRASFNSVSGVYLQDADKRNIKEARPLKEGALQKLLKLEPMSYLMKNQQNRDRSIGLVAQDVRTIFPALVEYVEGEEKLTLSYIELIPVLIKALQEQQNTIENLKRNQYAIQKEFAVFQMQMTQLAERLSKEETTFGDGTPIIAQNEN